MNTRLLSPGLRILAAMALAYPLLNPAVAHAEPASCLSSDPGDWPMPSRPYFMLAVDTSGSLVTDVGSNSTCGLGATRVGHLRCALRSAVQAFAGEVNLGPKQARDDTK
ncbi:MAG: hypothetical protein AB2A00_43625 [Myxococcota bacterium]